MKINISLPLLLLQRIKQRLEILPWLAIVIITSVILSEISIVWAFSKDVIVAYGDAESHLDIAKRVVHGLTPGFAQLGGIWLPLPHLLMIPFLLFDPLWRTGLAGSIVSGAAFVLSSITIYKLTELLTKSKFASVMAFLLFALNPNVLYMQATPMTELPLIAFSLFSTYYFVKYLKEETDYLSLILAAFFGFCATLSRYDGWFLVLIEAGIIVAQYIVKFLPDPGRMAGRIKKDWKITQGKLILFATLAFFGIGLWLLWDLAILGDPLYFTHSEFSARTQQQSWFAKGQLPAYKDLGVSILYYAATTLGTVGVINFLLAVTGCIYLLFSKIKQRFFIILLLFVPFIFYVVTLYIGQSIIFIPSVTPVGFEWRLFNVRYGIVMMPALAVFFGYLFSRIHNKARIIAIGLFIFQLFLFGIGYSKVLTYEDGTVGLSSAKRPDAESWMRKHYDKGLVLLDDYARTMSIIRGGIPMQSLIYVGTKPYWEVSLKHPEMYATWVVMQKDDSVWKKVYDDPVVRGRLFKYFTKTYTSPEILIFKRNNVKR